MVRPVIEGISRVAHIPDVLEEGKRLGENAARGLFYYGGMALGYSPFPIRSHYFGIGEKTHVEIDSTSRERLEEVATRHRQRREPIIVASNHRAVDVNLYPEAYWRMSMSVDSFIERSIFREYGMDLRTLAQYNRAWDHHRNPLRRARARAANPFREGLYSALGYIPVHTTHTPVKEYEKTVYVPRATYPYSVTRQVRECLEQGDPVNFFVYYGEKDDSLPRRIRPGAVLHSAMFHVPVLPVYIKNARHMDPTRTAPPDHVIFMVGEKMRFDNLRLERRHLRREVEAASQDLHQAIGDLRRQAFARQPFLS